MEHKGLIYTLAGTFLIAFFIGLIAFSLDRAERVIVLDSVPRGAHVYIDGKEVGKTPYEFRPYFLKKYALDDKNISPLAKIISPYSDGIAFSSTKTHSPLAVTFTLDGKGALPTMLDKGTSVVVKVAEKVEGKMDFLIMNPAGDRLIAVFEKNRIPKMEESLKLNSEIYAFKGEKEDIAIMELSEFKSFKIKERSSSIKTLIASKNAKELTSEKTPKKNLQNTSTENNAPEKPLKIDDFKDTPTSQLSK